MLSLATGTPVFPHLHLQRSEGSWPREAAVSTVGFQEGGVVVSALQVLSQDGAGAVSGWGGAVSRPWGWLGWSLTWGGLWAPLPGSARGCVGIGFLGAWSLREAELFPGPGQAAPGAGTVRGSRRGGVRGE